MQVHILEFFFGMRMGLLAKANEGPLNKTKHATQAQRHCASLGVCMELRPLHAACFIDITRAG